MRRRFFDAGVGTVLPETIGRATCLYEPELASQSDLGTFCMYLFYISQACKANDTSMPFPISIREVFFCAEKSRAFKIGYLGVGSIDQ